MNIVNPKTALISLSDKTNLEEIVSFLIKKDVKILSTGGTYKAIKEITDKVTEVSEFTGFEEMMDGRVKTLHPKIHAGILARRESDMKVLEERGYETIDLVIVNLYPFTETIKKGSSFEDAIENIDIGGPTMIRAAAKNFKDVVVVCNPNDYSHIIREWDENDGISYETRKNLSQKVFALMANYNKSISDYLKGEVQDIHSYNFSSNVNLRYGENPHHEAYDLSFKTDPTSAFGGIIAFNKKLDKETAKEINQRQFVELVIAPDYEKDAIKEFSSKKNIRVLRVDLDQDNPYPGTIKKVSGGILIQDDDTKKLDANELRCVTERKPSEDELDDLLFAWKVAKFVKSNAIVYVKNKQTIGIGAGQMSRVISAEIANLKAKEEGLEVKNAVMASDAFFPFRDGIDKAASSGIAAIIQPGGSIKDDEVIAAANEHNIAMMFTGMRHFRH